MRNLGFKIWFTVALALGALGLEELGGSLFGAFQLAFVVWNVAFLLYIVWED